MCESSDADADADVEFSKVRMRMWMRMLILMRMRMGVRVLILDEMRVRMFIKYIYLYYIIYIIIYIYFSLSPFPFSRGGARHNSLTSIIILTFQRFSPPPSSLSLSPQIFYPLLNSNSFHQNPSHSIHPPPLRPPPPPTLPISTSDLRTLPTILSSFILHVCTNHFSKPSSALSITPFFHLHISFILSFLILSILLNFHIALKPFISKALKLFLARELIIHV